MKNVVLFGELMLRLAPEGHMRLVQADRLEATYGGAEANVAVSLCNYGVPAAMVTRLPDNPLGRAAQNALRRYGVDTAHIAFGGERLGAYYMERGASQRPSLVVYDRAHSAMQTATAADFDWNTILAEADWFHFTGITPALGGELPDICMSALQCAKANGVTVSCDLNYRKKLWTTADAQTTMNKLMPYADVCIANEEDADAVFGIRAPHSDVEQGSLNVAGYEYVARALCERFSLQAAAITLRSSRSASDNGWQAMLYADGKAYVSRWYDIHIVDRVGGGDAFGAGLIYGMRQGLAMQDTLEFATAASCLKQTIEGDLNLCSADEVWRLARGSASGRVQR